MNERAPQEWADEMRPKKAADLAALIATLHRDLARPMPLHIFAEQLKRPTWDALARCIRPKSRPKCSDETRAMTLALLRTEAGEQEEMAS